MDCTQALDDFHFEDTAQFNEGEKKQFGCLEIRGVKHPVYNGENRIGRDASCSISVSSKALSKEHAVIEVVDANNHLIYDLGSRNKTRLGKMVLQPHVRYQLSDGTRLHLADVPAVYQRLPNNLEVDEDDDGSETGSESMLSINNSVIEGTVIVPETPGPSHMRPKCAVTVTESPSSASDVDSSFVVTNTGKLDVLRKDNKLAKLLVEKDKDSKNHPEVKEDSEDDSIFEAETQCDIDSLHVRKCPENKLQVSSVSHNDKICASGSDQEDDLYDAETQCEELSSKVPVKKQNLAAKSEIIDAVDDEIYGADTQCMLDNVPNGKSKVDLENKEKLDLKNVHSRQHEDAKICNADRDNPVAKDTNYSSHEYNDDIHNAPTQCFPKDSDEETLAAKTDAASVCSERTEEYICDDGSLSSHEDVDVKRSVEGRVDTTNSRIKIEIKTAGCESKTAKELSSNKSDKQKLQQNMQSKEGSSTATKSALVTSLNEDSFDRSMLDGDDDFFTFEATQINCSKETSDKTTETVCQKDSESKSNSSNSDDTRTNLLSQSKHCTITLKKSEKTVSVTEASEKCTPNVCKPVQAPSDSGEKTDIFETKTQNSLPSNKNSTDILKPSDYLPQKDTSSTPLITLATSCTEPATLSNQSGDETDPEDIFEAKVQSGVLLNKNEKDVNNSSVKNYSNIPSVSSNRNSEPSAQPCNNSGDETDPDDIFEARTQIFEPSVSNNKDVSKPSLSKDSSNTSTAIDSDSMKTAAKSPIDPGDTNRAVESQSKNDREFKTPQDSSDIIKNKSTVIISEKEKSPTQLSTDFKDINSQDEIFEAPTQIVNTPNKNGDFAKPSVSSRKTTTNMPAINISNSVKVNNASEDNADEDDSIFEAATQIVEIPNISSKDITKSSEPFLKKDTTTILVASNDDKVESLTRLHSSSGDEDIFEAPTQIMEVPTRSSKQFTKTLDSSQVKQETNTPEIRKSEKIKASTELELDNSSVDASDDVFEVPTQVIEIPTRSSTKCTESGSSFGKDIINAAAIQSGNRVKAPKELDVSSRDEDSDIFEAQTQQMEIPNRNSKDFSKHSGSSSEKGCNNLLSNKSATCSDTSVKPVGTKADSDQEDIYDALTQKIDDSTLKKIPNDNLVLAASKVDPKNKPNLGQPGKKIDMMTIDHDGTKNNMERSQRINIQDTDKLAFQKTVTNKDTTVKNSSDGETDSVDVCYVTPSRTPTKNDDKRIETVPTKKPSAQNDDNSEIVTSKTQIGITSKVDEDVVNRFESLSSKKTTVTPSAQEDGDKKDDAEAVDTSNSIKGNSTNGTEVATSKNQDVSPGVQKAASKVPIDVKVQAKIDGSSTPDNAACASTSAQKDNGKDSEKLDLKKPLITLSAQKDDSDKIEALKKPGDVTPKAQGHCIKKSEILGLKKSDVAPNFQMHDSKTSESIASKAQCDGSTSSDGKLGIAESKVPEDKIVSGDRKPGSAESKNQFSTSRKDDDGKPAESKEAESATAGAPKNGRGMEGLKKPNDNSRGSPRDGDGKHGMVKSKKQDDATLSAHDVDDGKPGKKKSPEPGSTTADTRKNDNGKPGFTHSKKPENTADVQRDDDKKSELQGPEKQSGTVRGVSSDGFLKLGMVESKKRSDTVVRAQRDGRTEESKKPRDNVAGGQGDDEKPGIRESEKQFDVVLSVHREDDEKSRTLETKKQFHAAASVQREEVDEMVVSGKRDDTTVSSQRDCGEKSGIAESMKSDDNTAHTKRDGDEKTGIEESKKLDGPTVGIQKENDEKPEVVESMKPFVTEVGAQKDCGGKLGMKESKRPDKITQRDGDRKTGTEESKTVGTRVQRRSCRKPAIAGSEKQSVVVGAQKDGGQNPEVAGPKKPGAHDDSGDETDPENLFETDSHKIKVENSNDKLKSIQKSAAPMDSRENEVTCIEDECTLAPSPTLLEDALLPSVSNIEGMKKPVLETESIESSIQQVICPDHSKDNNESGKIPLVSSKIKFDNKSFKPENSSAKKQYGPKSYSEISRQVTPEHKKPNFEDIINDSLNDTLDLIMPSSQELEKAVRESEAQESPVIPQELSEDEEPSPTIARFSRLPIKRAKVRKRLNIESASDTTAGRRNPSNKSSVHISMIPNTTAGINRRRKLPDENTVQCDVSNITLRASKQRKLSDSDHLQHNSKNMASDITSRRRPRGCAVESRSNETEGAINTDKENGGKGGKSDIVTGKQKGQGKTDASNSFQKESNGIQSLGESSKRERSSRIKVERNEGKEQDLKPKQSGETRGRRRGSNQVAESTKEAGKNRREIRSVNKIGDVENVQEASSRPSRQRRMTWKIRESLESDNSQESTTPGEEKSKSRSRGSSSNNSQNEINENPELGRSMRSRTVVTPTKSPSKKLPKSSEDSGNDVPKELKESSEGTDLAAVTQNISLRKSTRQSKGDKAVACVTDMSKYQSPQKVTRQNSGQKQKNEENTTEISSKRSRREELVLPVEKSQNNITDKCSPIMSRGVLNMDESLKDASAESNTRASRRKRNQTADVGLVQDQSTVITNISAALTENGRQMPALKEASGSSIGSVQGRNVRKRTEVTNTSPSCLKELNAASGRPQRGVKRTKISVEEDAAPSPAKQSRYEKRLSQPHSPSVEVSIQNDKVESVEPSRASRSRGKLTSPQKSETTGASKQDAKPGQRVRTSRTSKTELKNEPVTPKSCKINVSENQITTPQRARSSRGRGTPQSNSLPNSQERASCTVLNSPRRSTPRKAVCGTAYQVLFTGFSDAKQESIVRQLGGTVVDLPEFCTVLVTDKVRRTYKFLCIMGRGKPIVSPEWLVQCRRSGCFLDPWQFLIKDHDSESKFKFQLQDSLEAAAQTNLLAGYSIHVTPKVKPSPSEMKGIIESCGGIFLPQATTKLWPVNSFIISCVNDKASWSKLKKSGKPIVGPDVLLLGVLQQKLDLKSNTLV